MTATAGRAAPAEGGRARRRPRAARHALRAAVRLNVDVTAVVTVADDGGSSGRLRRELPASLPPGDLRMALAALAGRTTDRAAVGRDVPAPLRRRRRAGRPPGRQPRAGRADRGAGRSGRRAGRRRRAARRPRPGAADVPASRWTSSPTSTGLDEDPTAVRRIRGQVAVASTPGQVRAVAAGARPTARPARRRWPRSRDADLVMLRPRVLVHQRAAAPAGARPGGGARPAPRPAGWSCSTWRRSRGRPPGSRRSSTWTYSRQHAPDLRVDAVLADVDAVPVPAAAARRPRPRLGARLDLRDVAVPVHRGTTRRAAGVAGRGPGSRTTPAAELADGGRPRVGDRAVADGTAGRGDRRARSRTDRECPDGDDGRGEGRAQPGRR